MKRAGRLHRRGRARRRAADLELFDLQPHVEDVEGVEQQRHVAVAGAEPLLPVNVNRVRPFLNARMSSGP